MTHRYFRQIFLNLCKSKGSIYLYNCLIPKILPKFKMFRHAQTQHNNLIAEVENIVLCKSNIWSSTSSSISANVNNKSDSVAEGDVVETDVKPSTQCTWFFEVSSSPETNKPASETHIVEPQSTQNQDKRKAEEALQDSASKKAKYETKELKAKRPGFGNECYEETSYYMENGLRKVYPYYFTFTTFTKGRWVGEKLLDVFAREFRAHPAEEYERSINSGILTVNYEKVQTDYKLKHNDLLANIVHRHEIPVTAKPIEIVVMDDNIVVVNKPASIPVHPCGRYRHNTVVFILAKEYNLKHLRTIHRLDRLTSGLLLFGRTAEQARLMEHQIRNRQVQKEYICRVEGHFPDGVVECNQPITVVSFKIGVCKVSPEGKDCITTFERVSYNEKTSVVLCKPLTGRMHQIRVHLQYLGYPICNDPLYNDEVFGPHKGKGGDLGGKTDDELVQDLITIHNAENWLGTDIGGSDLPILKTIPVDGNVQLKSNADKNEKLSIKVQSQTDCSSTDNIEDKAEVKITTPDDISNDRVQNSGLCNNINDEAKLSSSVTESTELKFSVGTQTDYDAPDLLFQPDKMTTDEHCYECKLNFRDPEPKDLIMFLHAWKYKGPGWSYETTLPDWASIDWKEPID